MDRKWRTNRQAMHSVLSIIEFRNQVGEWMDSNFVSLTDLYAVYTVLHIENKTWEIHWDNGLGFYYFLAVHGPGNEKQRCVAPEGDEDVEIVVQDPEKEVGVSSSVEDRKQTIFDTKLQQDSERNKERISELIVPVSSSCTCLTPRVVHSLCRLGHGRVHQVILGLVDSNGVVTRCCLYDYIQAPLGGTGTAQLRPL